MEVDYAGSLGRYCQSVAVQRSGGTDRSVVAAGQRSRDRWPDIYCLGVGCTGRNCPVEESCLAGPAEYGGLHC